MSDNPSNPDRRKLTFAQAEGVSPLPQPLKLKEVSQELRALLWRSIHDSVRRSTRSVGYNSYLETPWLDILRDRAIYVHHMMVDDFNSDANAAIKSIRKIFEGSEYIAIFDFIQYVLRHPRCPSALFSEVHAALEISRAAYQLIDLDTIVPRATPEEGEAIKAAFSELHKAGLQGARTHLKEAGSLLTKGQYADSIRESIHAVESVARLLDPGASATLEPALTALEKKTTLHPALKKGFSAIYGYTSNAQGIRHALLDDPKAPTDMTDAVFMIGACASFISYLIGKARAAGIKV